MKKIFLVIPIILLLLFSQSISAAQVHRVSPGETLYTIARDYGVRIEEIIVMNNLKNPERIFESQVLIIPDRSVYYVESGDTLFQLAQNFNINIDVLIDKNNIENPDLLFVGQILRLPDEIDDGFLSVSVQTYKIQPGDSLYSISHRFGISIDTIIHLNEISDPHNLTIGRILTVPEYSFSELRRMYPDNFFMKGTTGEEKVALTFDDGPEDIYTPQVLDVLDEFDVPATFFYMGVRAEAYPEIVERTVQEGHVIANHSWSHPALTRLTDLEVYEEVKSTEIIMEQITGLRTALMRPPYGLMSQKIVKQLKNLNYKIIQWDVDSKDWLDQGVDQILINTIPDIRDDSIILFHSAGGENQSYQATVDVLPELIFTLKVQGYEFVTVDEIIEERAYNNI